MARKSPEPPSSGRCRGAFTASETFDVGIDLGSPMSLAYCDRAPFAFNEKISEVKVELK
jgi:hypothetical protein